MESDPWGQEVSYFYEHGIAIPESEFTEILIWLEYCIEANIAFVKWDTCIPAILIDQET